MMRTAWARGVLPWLSLGVVAACGGTPPPVADPGPRGFWDEEREQQRDERINRDNLVACEGRGIERACLDVGATRALPLEIRRRALLHGCEQGDQLESCVLAAVLTMETEPTFAAALLRGRCLDERSPRTVTTSGVCDVLLSAAVRAGDLDLARDAACKIIGDEPASCDLPRYPAPAVVTQPPVAAPAEPTGGS